VSRSTSASAGVVDEEPGQQERRQQQRDDDEAEPLAGDLGRRGTRSHGRHGRIRHPTGREPHAAKTPASLPTKH
jgi:hypothetical protein